MKGHVKSGFMEMALKESDYTRKSPLEKDFKFNRKLKDPRFGEVSLIQNPKTRQFIAVKEKRINDKKEAGRQIVRARKLMTHKHPNLLNLKDYSVMKQSELCSSFYVLKMFYEFPRSDLHREMNERKKKGEGFNDEELTNILYQQISANNYLQGNDQHHGNIQPLNIAYNRNTMTSKLIDTAQDVSVKSAPKGKKGAKGVPKDMTKEIQKNRLVAGHPLYQSPTTYANLKKGNLNYTVDPAKEDVYALGLTLLECGNSQSIQNIYDKNTKEVDQAALDQHLQEFKNKYGNENTLLVSTVETMVHQEEATRPNFRDLESQLPPYDDVRQFLEDKRNGVVQNEEMMTPVQQMYQEEQPVEQMPQPVETNDEWNFGNNEAEIEYANFDQNQQNVQQEIKLEEFPVADNNEVYFEQPQSNVQVNTGVPLFEQPRTNTVHAEPVVEQKRSSKVILLDDNNPNMYVPQNQRVYTEYKAPQDVSQSTNIQQSYATESHRQSYAPNQSYQTISRVEDSSRVVRLDPIIRREYIDIHGNSRVEEVPYTQDYKGYTSVMSQPQSQSNIVYQQPQQSETNIVYQQPQQTQYQSYQSNVVYQQPQSQVTYTQYQPQQPQVVTQQYQSYQTESNRQMAPQQYTVEQRVSNQNEHRVVNKPTQVVYETPQTNVQQNGGEYVVEEEVKEMKLVNSYRDNSKATMM